jgi:hypothetical protein
MLDASVIRWFSLCASTLVLAPACLTPPCPCAQGAAAPQAAAPAPAGVAPSVAASAPAAGDKAIIWDGDENGLGAKGWQDCDKKPDCKVTLLPTPGTGFNNSVGLKAHGEGPGWIGFGWNWFGWYPENGGTDVSGYKFLKLRIRVEAKNADEAPDPASIGVSIKCSSNKEKGQSKDAPLVKHTKENLIDGQWHEVTIPTAVMAKAEYDPKTAWEFVLSTWSSTPRNFNLYLDDIRFEN